MLLVDHRFKLMVNSQPFAEKPEEAIASVKKMLEGIQKRLAEEGVDQSNMLTQDLINRIEQQLLRHREANTYTMSRSRALSDAS